MFKKSLKTLRQEQGEIRAHMVKLAEKVDAKQPLTAEEREQLAQLKERSTLVAADLLRAEKENEAERRGEVASDDGETLASREAAQRAHLLDAGGGVAAGRRARPASDRTLAGMFGTAQASAMNGWASASEFCRPIALGLHDQRFRAATMTGTNSGQGGFAIPPGVFGPWLDRALESEIVRPRAAVWPMTTRERSVPAWDLTDRTSGIAGLTMNWEPEAPDVDPEVQVALIRLLQLHARRGAIFAEASNELLQDGLDFDAQLEQIMSVAIAYGLDTTFFHGTGANQPLGIFNSGALISVTRTTTNQILYEDIVAMFARMSPASISNSVWVAHSSTIPMLATLTVPVGAGGAHVPVMRETNAGFVILTRPVIFSEKAKPLGQLGDLGLFDFGQYVVGIRKEATLDRSAHVGFLRNKTTFRLQLRVDGMPNISQPFQPPNSAPTQSPFVALAA